MVVPQSWGDRDKKRTLDMGDDHPVTKVNDMSQASNKLAISGESVTLSAGAAGTTGVVGLDSAPVMDAIGALLGSDGDTSFAWVTGTILTNEVAYNEDVADSTQLSGMSNGDYAIDYATGKIRYKKATTGTSDTCNYTTRQTNIEITGSSTTVTPNVNINQVGGTSTVTGGASGLLGVGGNVAHDAADSGNPVKVGGKAQDPTSLPAAVSANDRADLMTDTYGRTVVYLGTSLDATNDEVGTTPRDISHANTTALATNLVVKASAGKLFEVRGYNSLASAQFIQVHDAASLPADTAVPEEVITVPASSNFSITFPQGKSFSTGVVVCNSSTAATKTIGAADCWISADYE